MPSSRFSSTSSVFRTSSLVPISSLLAPAPPNCVDFSPCWFKMEPKPAKSFLEFPAEVRSKVYRLLHIGDHVMGRDDYFMELSSQFFATCRQVLNEARPVLYGNNTFTIEINNQWREPDACVWGMPFLEQAGDNPDDPVTLVRRILLLVKYYPHQDEAATIEIAFRHVYHGILKRMRNIDYLNLRVLITRTPLRIDEVPSGIWSWVRLGGLMAQLREEQSCIEPLRGWNKWTTSTRDWHMSVLDEERMIQHLLASTLGNLRQVRGLSMQDVPEQFRKFLQERMESPEPIKEPLPPPPFVPTNRDKAPNRENVDLYWPEQQRRREKRLKNLPTLPGVSTFLKLDGQGQDAKRSLAEDAYNALWLDSGVRADLGPRPLSRFSIGQ